MRREFIEQIKTFLLDTPNFKDRLEEMRLEAIISGATEEEFDEAIKELSVSSPALKSQIVRPLMKKLVALDVVVHVFFIVFAVGSISLMLSLLTGDSFPHLLSSAQQKSLTQENPLTSESLLPRVYANGQSLDGARVFSYPASDVTLQVSGTPKREVFGFLPYWMIEEESKITYTGLTTISFFGLEMDGGGNIVTRYQSGAADEGWLMWNDRAIDAAIARARRLKIKTHITLKAFNNENIEHLVTSDAAQKTFISNTIHLVNSKALDGVTLDFEYVGTPSTKVTDNFTRFITNLKAEMKRQIPEATLSLATYVSAGANPGLFDLEPLSPHVDDFIIMGYDFHTPKGAPGPVAPMEGTVSLRGFTQSYLDKVPPEKLILALAHYGYDWPVNNDKSPVGDAEMLSYAEVAALAKTHTLSWDTTAKTPYFTYVDPLTSQNRVVHFENTRSLGLKYDYINEKNLKGVGIWALGYDGLNNDLRSLLLQKFAE
jgi:spore germination protein YaaH